MYGSHSHAYDSQQGPPKLFAGHAHKHDNGKDIASVPPFSARRRLLLCTPAVREIVYMYLCINIDMQSLYLCIAFGIMNTDI